MADRFLDFTNGNDANDATSFANRVQSWTSGLTAARIAPADRCKLMRSKAPTSLGTNLTLTDKSPTATLAAAVNANVDLCETAWTASANVTCTTNTNRKQGSNSVSIAIGAAFTTGLAAYKTLGAATDFSAYKQLSFWIRQTAGTLITSGMMRLCLCSDTVGAVVVDEFVIDKVGALNTWVPQAIEESAALGVSIQSIALYVDADNGAQTILLDNIIACKDSTAADSLTLLSLISHDSSGPRFWPIRSIDTTTITLDMGVDTSAATAARGYSGTTTTATGYKREPTRHPGYCPAAATTQVDAVQDSGTAGNVIEFSGGWDETNMTTQEDYTFVDFRNGMGYLYSTGKSYIKFDHIILVRGNSFYITGTCNNVETVDVGAIDCDVIASSAAPLWFDTSVTESVMGWRWCVANSNTGAANPGVVRVNGTECKYNAANGEIYGNNCPGVISPGYVGDRRSMNIGKVNNNDGNGWEWDSQTVGGNIDVTFSELKDNAQYAVGGSFRPRSRHPAIFRGGTMSGNTSGDVQGAGSGNVRFVGATFGSSTEVSAGTNYQDDVIYSVDHDGVAGAIRAWTDGGQINSESGADRHTASGIAWKLSPTSANRDANYPLWHEVGKFYAPGAGTLTLKAWVLRSNTGLTFGLRVRGGQPGGPAADQTVTMTAAAATYEELTLNITVTKACVISLEAFGYGGTTYYGVVDDVTRSFA